MALTDFLSKDDQTRITDAITMAEKRTSGEICVHITPKCGGDAQSQHLTDPQHKCDFL